MGEPAKTLPELKKASRRVAEETKQKIQASRIVNKLQQFVMGEVEMEGAQVRAAEILLNKVIPNVTANEMTVTNELKITATDDALKTIQALSIAKQKAGLTIEHSTTPNTKEEETVIQSIPSYNEEQNTNEQENV